MNSFADHINLSSAWKNLSQPAGVGFLAMQAVSNPAFHSELEQAKRSLEETLRIRFASQPVAELPTIQAYRTYYKRFKKSYHVQLQLESIVSKGKSIPTASALVECMFMAELDHALLTAGHDLDRLQLPVRCDVAAGIETYTLLRGEEQVLKPGDLYIADALGVMSSIIYGPDQRTQITPETQRVLFTVYAPPGITEPAVLAHLRALQSYVLRVAPQAETLYLGFKPEP